MHRQRWPRARGIAHPCRCCCGTPAPPPAPARSPPRRWPGSQTATGPAAAMEMARERWGRARWEAGQLAHPCPKHSGRCHLVGETPAQVGARPEETGACSPHLGAVVWVEQHEEALPAVAQLQTVVLHARTHARSIFHLHCSTLCMAHVHLPCCCATRQRCGGREAAELHATAGTALSQQEGRACLSYSFSAGMLGASLELVQGSSRPCGAAGRRRRAVSCQQLGSRLEAVQRTSQPAHVQVCRQSPRDRPPPPCLDERGLGGGACQLKHPKGGSLLQQGGSRTQGKCWQQGWWAIEETLQAEAETDRPPLRQHGAISAPTPADPARRLMAPTGSNRRQPAPAAALTMIQSETVGQGRGQGVNHVLLSAPQASLAVHPHPQPAS